MVTKPVSNSDYYFPNRMGRILLLAFEEVLGRPGLIAIQRLAGLDHWINTLPPNNLDAGFPFQDLGAMHSSLERMYGPRAGRGLALRTGRASFNYGLREFGPSLGASDLAFRLLPLPMKITTGLQSLAEVFNHNSDQIIQLQEESDHYLWQVERCPICWGRESKDPCCHFEVGMLQEALFWISGGKNYQVREIECIAAGDPACTIRIERHPLD